MPFKAPALAIAFLLAFPLAATADPMYTITKIVDIDGWEDDHGTVMAINNLGQAVGTFYHYDAAKHNSIGYPAIWTNGTVSVLPTPSGYFGSAMSGINDSGMVAGNFCASTLVASCALSTISEQGRVKLPTITGQRPGGGVGGFINNSGQVAGTVETITNNQFTYQAVLYTPGVGTINLNFGGQYNYAYAINNAGAVVGFTEDQASPVMRAVMYSEGAVHELGTLGGISAAFGINDQGVAVGSSAVDFDSYDQPVMYVDGKAVALGDTPGQALAINNAGVVVGAIGWPSWYPSPYDYSGFVYRDGAMQSLTDLVDPGWFVGSALDINDKGQILAEAYSPDRVHQYVLLTPTNVSPVPEPQQAALLMAGLALAASCAGYRRRQRTQAAR